MYLENSKNYKKKKLRLYINSIYANVYKYAITIHIYFLHVEINQRKMRNFKYMKIEQWLVSGSLDIMFLSYIYSHDYIGLVLI